MFFGRQSGFAAIALLAVTGVWWAGAQVTEPLVTWEFATVEALDQYNLGNVRFNSANICYHTPKGCQWETLRVNTARWSQTNDALAAATARLGERGWEVVSMTTPTELHRMTILMKRIRATQQAQ
jgi:hypothetical protein